jgi:Putative amidoligase enzyme
MRYTEFKQSELLDEVAMNPKSLQAAVKNIDAMAGMEFEMAVPTGSSGDGESTEDYDHDTNANDFEDIENFFLEGPNNRASVRDLISTLESEFDDWLEEHISADWDKEKEDMIRDHIWRHEVDEDTLRDDAIEQFTEEDPDFDPDSIEGKRQISEYVDNVVEEMVDEILNRRGDYNGRKYDELYGEFYDEKRDEYSQRDFLRENGIRYMTDITENYDMVVWPYWTDSDSDSDNYDIEEIASDFSRAVSRGINWSKSYHGAKRDVKKYVVEPDGSIDTEDGYTGLEFVSPPLPLNEMLSDLDKVVKWASRYGCETNQSTGLHMNISIQGHPDIHLIDYVKLALLVGDKYVLEQFGREANTYCKSAIEKLSAKITNNPDDVAALFDRMKGKLGEYATKLIHSGVTDKYTSINTKTGYVEFRSPGGDWLGEYAADPGKITNTLLRFVVALDAASDPQKYRQEYLKKLYKLLSPKSDKDPLSYFAQYAAGTLPKAALKSFIKQAQLTRKTSVDAKNSILGKKYWYNVQAGNIRIEVVATSPNEARSLAAVNWRVSPTGSMITSAIVTPLKPFEGQDDNWEIIKTDTGQSVYKFYARNQDEAINLAYGYIDNRNLNPSHYEVKAIGSSDQPAPTPTPAQTRNNTVPSGYRRVEVVRTDGNEVIDYFIVPNQASDETIRQEFRNSLAGRGINNPGGYGWRFTRPASAQQTFTGRWKILINGQQVFAVTAENQGQANQLAREWLSQRSEEFRREHQGGEVEVVPEYR